MNGPDLIQSKFFARREFTVTPDGISVQLKSLMRSEKYHVTFESIPPKPTELTTGSKKLMSAAVVFTILAAVCVPIALAAKGKDDWQAPVIWGGIAVVCWVWFFYSRKSLILFIQEGGGLVLLSDNPSAMEVDQFIKKLFMFRKDYLLRKYGRFADEESLESKLARLNLLRAQEALTEDEFELRRRSLSAPRKPSGPIGFSS